MIKKEIILGVVGICGSLLACEPEKLDRGKEMAVEAERHKVKRITQEDMEARALAAGDTVVEYIEGAFLQLAESQPKEQELFVAEPNKLPLVQPILDRYNAQLTRKTFASEAEAKQYLTRYALLDGKSAPQANVQLSVQDQEFVYQRPISIRRRNCASCSEPSLLDFSSQSLEKLRVHSAQGKPDGFQEGQVVGVWQIQFPRKKVIEQIALKTKVSSRDRLFGKQPDTTAKR